MLSILAQIEDSKLEEEKNRLMSDNAENQSIMYKLEEKILNVLSTTEGSKILDDEKFIAILSDSKKQS
jgi:hypothetical protein